MIVEGGLIRIIRGPRENLHRPAIDPLFRSAAAFYGRRAIGVVLTGLLEDGTSGLMVLRARGGEAIIQDPKSAAFPSMPESALTQVPDAHLLPLEKIPDLLIRLLGKEICESQMASNFMDRKAERETGIAELDISEIENEARLGEPSAFACPDCGGVLWELEGKGFLRFRCRVGHAFTARHLGTEQRHAIETALWAALRALEGNASLYRRMAARAASVFQDKTSQKFEDRAENITANAHVLRDFLLRVNAGEDDLSAVESAQTGHYAFF